MEPLPLVLAALGGTTTALHWASLSLAWTRSRRAGTPRATGTPPVTILRPVCGLEYRLEDTLGSTFALDWPDYEIVFCVARGDDPVVPLVRDLIGRHPQVPARLLVGNERPSGNPKLDNLFKGWAAARHDWVVMADSNVLLPPDYLRQLMASWGPRTGLVCSPPVGTDPVGFAAEVEAAFLNSHAARWQMNADALGFGFAQGKTMFWRRADLDRAGGLMAIGREAAEDAASTRLVRGAGLKVSLVPAPFAQPLGPRRWADVWRRQVRWARLRRVAFPAAYIPEILSGSAASLALLTAAAFLAGFGTAAIAALALLALALWYAPEAALAKAMGWPLGRRGLAAMILRDAAIPILWFAGLGDRFEWRGNAMHADIARPGGARRAFVLRSTLGAGAHR